MIRLQKIKFIINKEIRKKCCDEKTSPEEKISLIENRDDVLYRGKPGCDDSFSLSWAPVNRSRGGSTIVTPKQRKQCTAETFFKAVEEGTVDSLMEIDTNAYILKEFGENYLDYVLSEGEKLLFELSLIYEGVPNVWYAFIITPQNSNINTPNFIGVTQSPYRATALHSLNMVLNCKTTRQSKWKLRLFIGDFSSQEEAEQFAHVWRSRHRQDNRLEKGPQLASEFGKTFYYARLSECPFLNKL